MPPVGRRAVLRSLGTGAAAISAPLTGVEAGVSAADVPRTGSVSERFEPLEEAVVEYAAERDVEATLLGVLADTKPRRYESRREVVVQRAYGWADPERTRPLRPDARTRVASITKVVTDAAVHRLARRGAFDYDDPVFSLLDRDPPAGADPRLRDVTVQHCLDHEGGWNRDESFDPFHPLQFRAAAGSLGLSRPPSRRELLAYVFDRPLDFAPGTDYHYSNLGYLVLGTVVEDVTGEGYLEHVRRHVLEPAGASDVRLARMRPADRPADEVWYADGYPSPSAVDPTSYRPVRYPDGGMYLAALDAAAGLTMRTSDFLAFADAYDDEGHPRDDDDGTSGGTSSGVFPGTYVFAYKSFIPEVDVVVAFNRWSKDQGALLDGVEAALADVR